MTTRYRAYRSIFLDGVWHNNHALVALLGLCPLLAVSNNVVNALSLGLATTFVLTLSNGAISLIRQFVTSEIRIPVYITVIAALVTAVDLLMAIMTPGLHSILGIFIPLIVTNCIVLARAEAFASKNSVDKSLLDGFSIGLGFTLALVFLGGLREFLGHGTLFSEAELLFGPIAKDWTLHLMQLDHGMLIAILPPGAFIGLGLMIAVTNIIKAKQKRAQQAIQIAVTDIGLTSGKTA
ncbi:MAG: electron transport complex subunit E [Thiotrichales bacterium]|jgi:electron transport complex protein RnfE|nr:electron transport complex subunit E [Thiotrichales bacterium]